MSEPKWVCGVDEAGRGPLAGSVIAAAVVLNPDHLIEGLRDSKKLSALRREQLALQIRQHALAYGIGEASVAEIDQINILQATLLAMQRAVSSLTLSSEIRANLHIQIDGNRAPKLDYSTETIVKGDQKITAISAASILAKTYRDELMMLAHQQYPQYQFATHKGYGTSLHLSLLRAHGPCPLHRKSFTPVRQMLQSH